jgi:hypothetical protein
MQSGVEAVGVEAEVHAEVEAEALFRLLANETALPLKVFPAIFAADIITPETTKA